MKRFFLLATLAAAALVAQPSQRPAPTYTELKTLLTLTDAQVTSLVANQSALRTEAQTIMTQIHDKRKALKTAQESGSTDSAALGQLLVDIANLEKQLTALHTKYQVLAVGLLNADQKTKLAALAKIFDSLTPAHQAVSLDLITPPAGMGGERGFGPGGPGGPGGPKGMRPGPGHAE